MRLLLVMLGALLTAQCAGSRDDERFRVGESPRAFVIIGVAESGANTQPDYAMLWRRVDAGGAFMRYGRDTVFEARTHVNSSVRVRGVPGEFAMAEVDPGVYALDSVFAVIHDERVDYSANGVITGPERPTFEVRPGEAVYLGIWETNLEDVTAVTRLWRLDGEDARAAMRRSDPIIGSVRVRETYISPVACAPHRISTNSQRQVC
jgi:hypothetical protein